MEKQGNSTGYCEQLRAEFKATEEQKETLDKMVGDLENMGILASVLDVCLTSVSRSVQAIDNSASPEELVKHLEAIVGVLNQTGLIAHKYFGGARALAYRISNDEQYRTCLASGVDPNDMEARYALLKRLTLGVLTPVPSVAQN